MNKFKLEIALPIWVVLIFIFLIVFLTFLYYRRTNPEIPLKLKSFLIIIRSLALFSLIIVFAQPILSIIKNYYQKPKIAVLIDNSQSMNLTYGQLNKKAQVKYLFSETNVENFDKIPISFFTFGQQTKFIEKFKLDSCNFSENETNLSNAFRTIYSLKDEENIQALLLITDGIYNVGENPIPLATKLGIPITTIAIGDTFPPKDIAITSIITSEETFVGKEQPIKVNIKSYGYNKNLKVTLLEEKSILDEKIVQLTSQIEDYSLTFSYKPSQEGFKKLIVRAEELPEEFTLLNNQQSQIIKVRKNKNKFIIFSGYPNPDISFINRIILSQEGNEVSLFIQKKSSEFYDPQPTKEELEKSNVIILISFPISSTPENIVRWIADELSKGKSFLFIAGLSTDFNRLKILEEFLPFTPFSNNSNEFPFVANFLQSQIGNPLVKITGSDKDIELLNQLPPIFRTELFTRIKPESEVIANVKVNNVELKEPFILYRDFQNQRSVAILGYGLYRWQLLGLSIKEITNSNQENIDIGTILINNILNWLTVTQDFKRIKFTLSKNKLNSNEKLGVKAELFDESFSPINDAFVKIKIRRENNFFEFVLPQIGNGLYFSEIGPFAEGDYYFETEIKKGNTLIERSSGRFIVEKASLEYLDFETKINFLHYISQQTGGKFFIWNQTASISNYLNNLNLKTLVLSKQKDIQIWNSLPPMLIGIILLSIEWFIRKRLNLM
ncbi:MAG: hypothetical protein ACUVQ1_05540 [Candidatus Kapaibacteriales bacterium]